MTGQLYRFLCSVAVFFVGTVVTFGESGVVYSEKSDIWNVDDLEMTGKLQLQVAPVAKRLARYAKIVRYDDRIEFDLRDVFAKGATRAFISTPVYADAQVVGQEAFFDSEWTFPRGVQGRFVLHGSKGRSNWWMPSMGGYDFGLHFRPMRRHFRRAHEIPSGITKVCQRLDLVSGGDGPIVFHSHRGCPASEAVDELTLSPCSPGKVLFAESFDDARIAGLEYVEGRKGKAVRFTKAHPGPYVLPVSGHLNPERGAMDFWVKREWDHPRHFSEPTTFAKKPRYIFDLPAGKCEPGSGAMKLLWDNNYFYFRRGDVESTEIKGHKVAYSPLWRHYVVVWDDQRTMVYCNGIKMPYGHFPPQYRPLVQARKVPKKLDFARQDSDFGNDATGDAPFEGCLDELRIWSEPMDDTAARKLFEEANGGPQEFSNGWDSPFDPLANPPPPTNWLVSAPLPVGGVPADLELVERFQMDDIARLSNSNVYRKVGDVVRCELNGTPYLEVFTKEDGIDPRLAIRLKLEDATPFYVIEVDYPDDKMRTMEIIAQRSKREKGQFLYATVMQTGVMSGEEYPLSGKMRTVRCVYWSEDSDSVLILRDVGKTSLAVSEVRLYRPKTVALPAAMPDSLAAWNDRRHFALYSEDVGFARHFGLNFSAPGQVQDHLDRQVAYMKFCGQDLFVYPGIFYDGLLSNCYAPGQHPNHYLKEIARRFDQEGLGLMPSLHRVSFDDPEGAVTRQAIADGNIHRTGIMINDTGRPNPCTSHFEGPMWSFMHPDVRRQMKRDVRNLLNELKDHHSFKGLCINLNYRDSLWWGGIESGYNDYIIEAFEQATGLRVPVDRTDVLRGKWYAEWLKANAYETWVNWRCDVLTDFYKFIDAEMKAVRKDARLWIMAEPRIFHLAMGVDGWESPGIVTKMLREAGIDGAKLSAAIPDAIVGNVWRESVWRDELVKMPGPPGAREKVCDLMTTPDYGAAVRCSSHPALTLWDSYFESALGTQRGVNQLSGDWLDETKWRVSVINPIGRNALRDFALGLKFGDVLELAKGGFSIGTYGTEDVLVPWMRAFRSLPAIRFDDLPSPSEDVVFRGTSYNGVAYRYLCNTSSDPCDVSIEVRPGEGVSSVALDAYELKVWSWKWN